MFREPSVVLFSPDPERVTEFYRKLGFAEVFRTPREGLPIHIDVALGGYRIGFSSMTSARDDHGLRPSTEPQRAAVILWTDDVAAALDHSVEHGARLLHAPSPWLDVLLIAWVSDPDDNAVQLVQRISG